MILLENQIIPQEIIDNSKTIQNLIKTFSEEIRIDWKTENLNLIFSIMMDLTETDKPIDLIETIRLASYLDYPLKKNLHLKLVDLLFIKKSLIFKNKYIEKFNLLKSLALDDLIKIINYLLLDEQMISDLLATIFIDKTRAEMFEILGGEEIVKGRSHNRTIYWASLLYSFNEIKIKCLVGDYLNSPHAWIEQVGNVIYYLNLKGNLVRLTDNFILFPEKTFRKMFFLNSLILEGDDNCIYKLIHQLIKIYELPDGVTIDRVILEPENHIMLTSHIYFLKNNELIPCQTDLKIKYKKDGQIFEDHFDFVDNKLVNKRLILPLISISNLSLWPVLTLFGSRIVGPNNFETFISLDEDEEITQIRHGQNLSIVKHISPVICILTNKDRVYWYNGRHWETILKNKKIINIEVVRGKWMAEAL